MIRSSLALGLLLAGLSGGIALAERTPPLVVELFTSQGCSSCPPSNAALIELAKRPDVLALSFSVTYWDRLGWTDTFGQKTFDARQVAYEPGLGQRGPYTPQIVVNGRATTRGVGYAEAARLVDATPAIAGPEIALENGRVTIGQGTAPANGVDVWLVQYDPHTSEVPVARGENAGRAVPHTHVVHNLKRLGGWDGAPTSYAVGSAGAGLKLAVLVQARAGRIVAAVTE